MFTKNTWIVSLVLSSALLSACQGENTFTRQSDPYPEYTHLYDNAQSYNANRPAPNKAVPVDVKQTPACNEPFKMTIEDSKDAGKTLEFVAGVEKSVLIKVESRLEPDRKWDVSAVITPCPECFTPVEKTASSATYKFTWKPTQAPAIQDQFLVLRYNFLMDVRCQHAPDREIIALIVKPSATNEPVVTFPGLQTKPVVFGGEPVKVVIQVTDPKGTSEKAPDLTAITYRIDDVPVKTSKVSINALDCQKKGSEIQTSDGQQAWAFDCAFEPKLLFKNSQVKKLSGSGKTVTAEFSVQAKSKATKLYSDISTAKLQVMFEKVQGE